MPGRPSPVLLVTIWSLLVCTSAAAAASRRRLQDEDDVKGPLAISDDKAESPSPLAADVQANTTEKKTIAQIIDAALEQEFPEEKQDAIGKNYNETAKNADARVETVIKVSQNRKDEDDEEAEAAAEKEADSTADASSGGGGTSTSSGTGSSGTSTSTSGSSNAAGGSTAPGDLAAKEEKEKKKKDKHKDHHHHGEAEVDRIIDAQDNEYILSKPKDGTLGLTLDPQLIRDLTVLITSSTGMGMILESLRQPVINGYLIAGSIVGPGGLQLIKELVQVESLAQVGVQLLLFTLGLEFSLSKLRAVRGVALLGGVLQVLLTMVLAGGVASAIGASIHEGVFIGALVSMSSTSIVIKCLTDARQSASLHGQITIGTLILQDCMVGLLFAFMPVLGHKPGADVDDGLVARLLFKVVMSLGLSLAVAVAFARTVLPRAVRQLALHATDELYQLTIIAFCLIGSWISGRLGLSTELGAFVAGVMLSTTDQQEHALHQLEQVKGFFMSLFIASTGLIMSPRFLAAHLPVLAAGMFLVILGKSILISLVVWMFQYPPRTAVAVGLSMAQIGEFAFVLLSSASQHGLLAYQVYMLLMGVTGLSLLITPFIMQLSTRYLQLDSDDGKLFRAMRQHQRFGSGSGGSGSELADMAALNTSGRADLEDGQPPSSPSANGMQEHTRHRPANKGRTAAGAEPISQRAANF